MSDFFTNPEKRLQKKFILLLSTCLIAIILSGLISYWFNYVLNNDKKRLIDESNLVVLESNYNYKVVGDKYIIEYIEDDNEHFIKVLDFEGNCLYKGKEKYTKAYTTKKGELYIYIEKNITNYDNKSSLYKIKNEKLELVKSFSDDNLYYVPLLTKEGEKDYLVGVIGSSYNKENKYSTVYLMDGTEYNLDDYYIIGNNTNVSAPKYVTNDNYVVITNYKDNITLFGVYDIINKKLAIEPSYTNIIASQNRLLVAIKDEKAGLIDINNKTLLEFDYDFIEPSDNFFVVIKEGKMGIVDEKGNKVTDLDYYLQDNSNNLTYYKNELVQNPFRGYKVGNKYVLVNNYAYNNTVSYTINEMYVIDSEGNSEVINEVEFYHSPNNELNYSYSLDGKLTIYNENMVKKFDIKVPDRRSIKQIKVINNTLVIESNQYTFVDMETGEKLDNIKNCEYKIDKLRLVFDAKEKEIQVYSNNALHNTYSYNPLEQGVRIEKNNDFYFVNEGIGPNRSLFITIKGD